MAVDSRQRHVGDGVGIDCSAFYRIDIPLFVGSYRTKQFGYSSAITNITLVLATTLTGYLAEVNWHLPFWSICFLLYPFPYSLSEKDLSNYHSSDDIPADTVREMGKRGINVKALVKLMAFTDWLLIW